MKYKIGDMAKILGISPDLLRYYEKKGVVSPVKDRNNDYRYYDTRDTNFLVDCLFYKNFGFSIEETSELVRSCSIDEIAGRFLENETQLEESILRQQLLLRRSQEYRRSIAATRRVLPYILAENALGQPLGYACAHPWRYGRDAYAWDTETTIYLAPAARRLGLGTLLYNGLLAALAEQGYRNAYAVLADPNPESEAFHTAFGFVCEGRQARTGYKNGWQGVSYWLLDLADPAADPDAPPVLPAPLPAGRLEDILAAARLGAGWRAIAGR